MSHLRRPPHLLIALSLAALAAVPAWVAGHHAAAAQTHRLVAQQVDWQGEDHGIPAPPALVGERSGNGAPPRVGAGILPVTRTCIASRDSSVPRSGTHCSRWEVSGPVNVVVYASRSSGSPFAALLDHRSSGWTAAQGNWLVLGAATTGGRCPVQWWDSTTQIEHRLSRTTRMHFKVVAPACTGSAQLLMGEAHTDRYDAGRCGGDYVSDFDGARDNLVHAILAVDPGALVEYRHDQTATFPDGCGRQVHSDGQVAYITLG